MARTKEFEEEAALKKAMNLFWSKGYNGTSMQEIVDAMELSRSSIYDTFGDKEHLFLEALKKYGVVSSEKVFCLINNSTDARDTVREIFEGIVQDVLNDTEQKGCFVTNAIIELAPHNPVCKEIAESNMKDLEDAFFKLLEKGQSAGQIATTHDPKALACFLSNTITGIRVATKAGVDKKVLEDIIKVTLSVL